MEHGCGHGLSLFHPSEARAKDLAKTRPNSIIVTVASLGTFELASRTSTLFVSLCLAQSLQSVSS